MFLLAMKKPSSSGGGIYMHNVYLYSTMEELNKNLVNIIMKHSESRWTILEVDPDSNLPNTKLNAKKQKELGLEV